MAKVTKPKRSSVSIFNEKNAFFFYENILLIFESDKTSYGDEKSLREAAARVNANVPFDFVYQNYEVEMQTPKDNVFYFSADAHKKGPARKYTNIVNKWYKHLRNAFAHNYIRIENGVYMLEDYNEGKQVLFARVLSLDEFKSLINEVIPNIK